MPGPHRQAGRQADLQRYNVYTGECSTTSAASYIFHMPAHDFVPFFSLKLYMQSENKAPAPPEMVECCTVWSARRQPALFKLLSLPLLIG